jgi:hypothetical protein
MKLLIVSTSICRNQKYEDYRYIPSDDIELYTADINDSDPFVYSLFDFDISIIHIEEPRYNSLGYFVNLPKLEEDFVTALNNSRTIICLAETSDFRSKRPNDSGKWVYEWLSRANIELRDNIGFNIKPSGSGQSQVIKEYLDVAPIYYQIITKPIASVKERLAVVADTEIVVGMEHQAMNGTIVILPPPKLSKEYYTQSLSKLVEVSRRYYDRSLRQISIGDAPEWLSDYLPVKAKNINNEIENLNIRKIHFDNISYSLYGTSQDLENSIATLLRDIGFEIEPTPKGANFDLIGTYNDLQLGFAFEVTGSRDSIKKDNNKVSQAWQYLNEREGTPFAQSRLVIIANTQCHLEPNNRKKDAFSPEVIKLLGKNGVLLVTSWQLYQAWLKIKENQNLAHDFAQLLYETSGLFSGF